MKAYEISELEGRELHCEWCGEPISTEEYVDNEGFCDNCASWPDESDEEN
jgi:hypothetical protein